MRRFFAHSISPARSRNAVNRYGIGKDCAMRCRTCPLCERISGCSGEKRRNCAKASAWKVFARMPVAPSACSLLLISPAAFAVKVTARISPGMNAPVATWFAMRRVIVVVFPDPAPARMHTGPRTASTARRWSGLSPSKITRRRYRSGGTDSVTILRLLRGDDERLCRADQLAEDLGEPGADLLVEELAGLVEALVRVRDRHLGGYDPRADRSEHLPQLRLRPDGAVCAGGRADDGDGLVPQDVRLDRPGGPVERVLELPGDRRVVL